MSSVGFLDLALGSLVGVPENLSTIRDLGHMESQVLLYKAGAMMLLLGVMSTYDLLTVSRDDGMSDGIWIGRVGLKGGMCILGGLAG